MNAPNDQPPPEPGDNEEAPTPDSSDDSPTTNGDSPEFVVEPVSDSDSRQPEPETSGGTEVDSGAGELSPSTESFAAELAPSEPGGDVAPPLVHQTPPIPGSEPSSSVPADQLPPSSSTYNYGPPMPVAPPYPFGHPNAAVRGWAKLHFRWKRAKRPGLVLAIILSVMVLFISLVTWLAGQQPAPKQAVDDYLSALQEGDVEEALRLTTLEPEELEYEELLTSEILNSEWDIDNLELTHEWPGRHPGTQYAYVEVTLEAPDGTTATSGMTVSAIDDDWRVQDALIDVSLDHRFVDHMAINGFAIDIHQFGYSTVDISLFPGLYDFSLESVEVLEASTISLIGVGERAVPIGVEPSDRDIDDEVGTYPVFLDAELAPGIDELAQSQVDDILDECSSHGSAGDVEFGNNKCLYNVDESHLFEVVDLDLSFFASWEEYNWHDHTAPEVTVEWDAESGNFTLSVVRDGTVEFTGVIDESSEDDLIEVVFECTYGVENLDASLDPNGGISVEGPEYSSESNAVCQVAD